MKRQNGPLKSLELQLLDDDVTVEYKWLCGGGKEVKGRGEVQADDCPCLD